MAVWRRPVMAGASALLVSLLPFSIVPSFACSCIVVTPGQQGVGADAVFTGTAISVTITHPQAPIFSSADPLEAVFQVETAYKGQLMDRATVRTVASGASCGYEFQRGQRYTVFAQSRDGTLTTHLCSGTIIGSIDPARFGLPEGVAPQPTAVERLPMTGLNPWVPLAAGFGLLSIVSGFLLLHANKPRSS